MREASRVTILTGAGVSAASGVPTFRGVEGLWNDFRPEELATASAFARDPAFVWKWYSWRRELVARCRPNRAHDVIAAWSCRYSTFTLVTQNVDGLHERAGTQNVVRFHGSLWELRCWNACATSPTSWTDETVPFRELPPACPHCGGIARPGVVWFGEEIDREVLRRAADALDCDICVVVGTSAVVYPAAGLADEARRRGAFTVEINPERTEATDRFDVAIQGRAEDVLDRLERRMESSAIGSSRRR